jgi:hypothetical protein
VSSRRQRLTGLLRSREEMGVKHRLPHGRGSVTLSKHNEAPNYSTTVIATASPGCIRSYR